jgi:hypothetical protein
VTPTASNTQTGQGNPVCESKTAATAPIISVSPWAKLIRRKMPKTIASPIATRA